MHFGANPKEFPPLTGAEVHIVLVFWGGGELLKSSYSDCIKINWAPTNYNDWPLQKISQTFLLSMEENWTSIVG